MAALKKFSHAQIQIKVKPFTGNKKILGEETVCKSSTHKYSAETNKPTSSFWWEVIGGKIISDSTGPEIEVKWSANATSGKIRSVEISEFGCPADTITKDIVLLDIPPANPIIGPLIVCEGTVDIGFSVTKNPGNTYDWVAPAGLFPKTNENTMTLSFPTKGIYRIGLVETNSLGCPGDTNFVDVEVIRPEPLLLGPNSVCPHRMGILYFVDNPAAGSSFSWSVSGGTIASGGSSDQITVDWGGVGIGTVTVVETDQYGCASFPVSLNVAKEHNLKGQKPIGDTSVCENDIVEYHVYESAGSVYAWTVVNGLRQDTDSLSKTKVLWGTVGAGRIGVQERSYDPVNNIPCLSPWTYLDVQINPIPTADEIEGEYTMCQGDREFKYRVLGFPGSTYEWLINGQKDGFSGQGTNEIGVVWDQPGSFVIEVREMSKDSCPGQWIDSTVTVNPTPMSQDIVGENVICGPNYYNQKYRLSGLPNSTFEWNITGGTIVANYGDSIEVNWDAVQFGELWVIETSEFGCVGDTLRMSIYISELTLDIKKVSVGFPDDRMYIRWDNVGSTPFDGPYIIQKRVAADIGAWVEVARENFTDYLETPLNTDLTGFEYRIVATDLCGNQVISDVHTNVLLKGNAIDNSFDVELDFSDYLGWDNGVDRYELMIKENSANSFSTVGIYSPGERITYSGSSSSYRLCFRVKAFENVGGMQESWSNELCFNFSPNVFIPTAFSPNKDNINEEFFTVNTAINTYKLQIFNRWGEKLFETEDPNGKWDGTSKGNAQQMGVYVAVVTFTDFQGKAYEKSATFTLLR